MLEELAQIKASSERLDRLASDGQIDISTLALLKGALSKHAVICAGSYFESEISKALSDMFSHVAAPLQTFVKKKALERQFANLFAFDSGNANKLFGYFGSEFSASAKAVVARDQELAQSIRAFLQLCHERNRLVHNDYSSAVAQFSVDETLQLVEQAGTFTTWIRGGFVELCQ